MSANGTPNPAVDEATRLAAAQAERLARRAEQAALKPETAPEAVIPQEPQVVSRTTVTLLSNGRAVVDAPLDREDLCYHSIQALFQTMAEHKAKKAAALAVEQHRKLPFMKKMFAAKAHA